MMMMIEEIWEILMHWIEFIRAEVYDFNVKMTIS